MEIKYANAFTAWEDFKKKVEQVILEKGFKHVADIGGGANPLLAIDFLEKHKISCCVIDISATELAKADEKYEKKMMDLEMPGIGTDIQFDFIFAQMTLEHIQNPSVFYKNIHSLLKPGCMAFFFFACVTTLPTIANLLMPEYISKKILLSLQPFREDEKHGKFKAYYRWCYGPTPKNIIRFKSVDFDVMFYTGYFGHSYYERIAPFRYLEKIKTTALLKFPNPYLCSYAHVLLKKEK